MAHIKKKETLRKKNFLIKWPREVGLAVTRDRCKCAIKNAGLSAEQEGKAAEKGRD